MDNVKSMFPFIVAILIFTVVVGGSTATAKQDQSTVTAQEKKEVQEFAKRFVARLLKTRDVRPLIAEFFLTDFTAVPKQDFYEKVSPELYAKLNKNERIRLFVAQENLGYIITLDVMTQAEATDGLPFQRILPAAIARKLSRARLVEGNAKFTTRKELLKELNRLERAILEARPFLKQKNIEQSDAFLKKLGTLERDPHLGYQVRASVIDEDLKREFGFARIAAGEKMFSVVTPILIELIVAKDGGKFKILTLVPADGE